ncbi:MAG: hypothetical protein ACFFD7_13480 [Candidatus Thorarchaeota archaeon]
MRVFISDLSVKRNRYGSYYEILGELQSGLEIYIEDHYYDLEECIGRHVEMLLSVLRSPYLELERGINNDQLFAPWKYYSIEVIEEMKKKMGSRSVNSKKNLILSGEFIDSYVIPEGWIPCITSDLYKGLFLRKKPSALRTEDGLFLLRSVHLEKKVPIEQFPQQVTIGTGCIDLVAWYPL